MIYDSDPYLAPYRERIDRRYRSIVFQKQETAGYGRRLCDAVNNHLYYGVHLENDSVVFREWAPNATAVYLIGEMNGWRKEDGYRLRNVGNGNWELRLPAGQVPHGTLFKWYVEWSGGAALCSGPADQDILGPGMVPSEKVPLEARICAS